MISEERLSQIFKEVGVMYGYRNIDAVFINAPDLKVKWVRQGSNIRFQISDYLRTGEEAVIYSLANTIFERMSNDADAEYGPDLVNFVTSPQFAKDNRAAYKSRNRGFRQPDQKLTDSLDRLTKKGQIKPLGKNVEVFYHDNLLVEPPKYKASKGSPLFKVVCVNSKFKNIDDPELLDYAVFKAVTEEQVDFGNNPQRAIMERMEDYPNSSVLDYRLATDYNLYNKKPKKESFWMKKVKL